MSVTSPPSITALPDAPDPNNRTTFNALAYPWSVALDTFGSEVDALGSNVYENALEAYNSATTAAAAASNNYKGAWSALSGAVAIPATATHLGRIWILQESVADVTAHTPGTSSKWVEMYKQTTPSSSASATITADRTLTNTSARAQRVASTVVGCCFILPDATTLDPGTPFYLQNTGSLPIGIRANGNTLQGAIDGRANVVATCVDNTTAAGTWQLDGSGLLPGLITVDTTLSSTYATTAVNMFVDLDGNKSIHFAMGSSGTTAFYAICFDSQGKTSGTPLQVESGATTTVLAAFKISTTRAIVFWKQSTNYRCCVLDVSGTTITKGTTETTTTDWNPGTAEDGIAPPKFLQLSTSLYLVVDNVSTTDLCATAISVSGTSCTIGTRGTSAVTDLVANSVHGYVIDSTKALIFYQTATSGPTTPYLNKCRVVSVSVTTPTFNAAASITGVDNTSGVVIPITAQLTSTLYVIAQNNNTSTTVTGAAISVSGTTASPGTAITIDSGLTGLIMRPYGANASTNSRYNRGMTRMSDTAALLTYTQGTSSGTQSRAVVLTVSSTNTLTAGSIYQGTFSADVSTSTAGYGVALTAAPGELLTLTQQYTSSTPYALLVPHNISGSTITTYPGQMLNAGTPEFVTSVFQTRLSNGNTILFTRMGTIEHGPIIIYSNGYGATIRGQLGMPSFALNQGSGGSLPDLTNGTMLRGPTNGQVGSTALLRMCRLELAA